MSLSVPIACPPTGEGFWEVLEYLGRMTGPGPRDGEVSCAALVGYWDGVPYPLSPWSQKC
jgi:hypothetical protein